MTWNDLSEASLHDILAWAHDQPWCRAMAECQQDGGWHSEGDVWTHTRLVCAQLPRLSEWPSLTTHERTVLTFTALFHDAAKPLTSQTDPTTGRIISPKHAIKTGEHPQNVRQPKTASDVVCKAANVFGILGPTLATFDADVGVLRIKDNERL